MEQNDGSLAKDLVASGLIDNIFNGLTRRNYKRLELMQSLKIQLIMLRNFMRPERK